MEKYYNTALYSRIFKEYFSFCKVPPYAFRFEVSVLEAMLKFLLSTKKELKVGLSPSK